MGRVEVICGHLHQHPTGAESKYVGESVVQKFLKFVLDKAVHGGGGIRSAEDMHTALDYLEANNYDRNAAIDSLIKWKMSYAGASGFITNLGGLSTALLALPVGMLTSCVLAASTVCIAAIGCIRGFDSRSDQVQTAVVLCLLGGKASGVFKSATKTVVKKVAVNMIQKVPGKALIAINKQVGFRLLTKAGKTGVLNLMQWVPIVGSAIGAGFDANYIWVCANTAREMFPRSKQAIRAEIASIREEVLEQGAPAAWPSGRAGPVQGPIRHNSLCSPLHRILRTRAAGRQEAVFVKKVTARGGSRGADVPHAAALGGCGVAGANAGPPW
jgi:hypothetical protein